MERVQSTLTMKSLLKERDDCRLFKAKSLVFWYERRNFTCTCNDSAFESLSFLFFYRFQFYVFIFFAFLVSSLLDPLDWNGSCSVGRWIRSLSPDLRKESSAAVAREERRPAQDSAHRVLVGFFIYLLLLLIG